MATVIQTLEQRGEGRQSGGNLASQRVSISPAISEEEEGERAEFAAEIARENWPLFV